MTALSLFLILWMQSDAGRPIGYAARNPVSGVSSLNANLALLDKPTAFTVTELWRYSPERHRWFKLTFKQVGPKTIVPKAQSVYSRTTDTVVADLTSKIGLYWVKWSEDGHPFESFVYSGPMLCEDVAIGPLSKGDMVATCVPAANSATAAYVPDPKLYCK